MRGAAAATTKTRVSVHVAGVLAAFVVPAVLLQAEDGRQRGSHTEAVSPGDNTWLDKAAARMSVHTEYLTRRVGLVVRDVWQTECRRPESLLHALDTVAESVRSALGTEESVRRELLARLELARAQVRQWKQSRERAQALERQRAAVEEAQNSLILTRERDEQQLELLIETVRQSRAQADGGSDKPFENAIAAAREGVARGRGASAARQALLSTRSAGQLTRSSRLRARRTDRFLATLGQVERSHVPFSDEPPLVYPGAEVWRALSLRRTARWPETDRRRAQGSVRRIHAALSGPAFAVTGGGSLSDFLKEIERTHGFRIVADRKALDEVGITSLAEINVDADLSLTGLSLKGALNIVLEHLDGVDERLTWVIRNEVLYITTESEAKKDQP